MKTTKRTQYEVILAHLKDHKTITSMEAIQRYGITRLSDIIYKLRRNGYNVVSKTKVVRTRYNHTNVSEYSLCD